MITMKTIFVFCVVFIFASDALSEGDRCQTPNGKEGTCIDIVQCKPLFKTLKQKSISEREHKFLLDSTCSIGSNPIVCCPFNEDKKALLPPPGECGTQTKERIVGGTVTSILDFPWFALINYARRRQRPEFRCGGSLINRKYVITAAHCVHGKMPTSVRLGEHDLLKTIDCEEENGKQACAESVKDIEVIETIVHENYRTDTMANDIALLRLSSVNQIVYSYYIKPICLPFDPALINKDFNPFKLVVTGFGTTEYEQPSKVKRKLEIDGVDLNNCSIKYQWYNHPLTAKQLCAGGVIERDACSGDSGGPLMGECIESEIPYTYLAGVVSFGPNPCGQPGIPGVYTRVDQYLHWILDKIKR